MKAFEYLCYFAACLKGLFLFALSISTVLLILGIETVFVSFFAVYVAAKAKPEGGVDEGHPYQRVFRILQKAVLIFLISLGFGAFLFGSAK
ncbi:MAG: hypothetical protein P1U89_25115 [Verrucomicrobiales bacterium]|nr:hypothetical protein [Verrucomicrobiales bacterium]